jgi:outer membrane protein assembly factor BamB
LIFILSMALNCNSFDHQAKQLVQLAAVKGGVVVHIGCGTGELTSALRVHSGYIVHGLDTDTANVQQARQTIQKQDLYGQVTIDGIQGNRLPYIDNLVNLIVCEYPDLVPHDEMMRVLCPRGVLLTKQENEWTKTIKPESGEMDDWTHYLHDPSNNAVSHDQQIGPSRHLQWTGGPRWTRHHDFMSSLTAMVSANGRIFYILDEGPRWSIQMPPEWFLVARDAFNGKILWKKPIDNWHTHLWPLKNGPAQLPRRLVAVKDRVYVTLGIHAPLSVLDATTGQELKSYDDTDGTEEILVQDDHLFLLVNPHEYTMQPRYAGVSDIRKQGRNWNWDEKPRKLVVIDTQNDNIIWEKEQRVVPLTLTVANQNVYFHNGEKIECLDSKTGNRIWQSKSIPRWSPMNVLYGPTLVAYQDVILFSGGENMTHYKGGDDTMTALSATTGEVLWQSEHPPSGYASPEDLFVIDGAVWTAPLTNRRDTGVFTGRNVNTGEIIKQFPPDDGDHMPHHRCHRARATDNYILTSRTGIEFVDFRNEHWDTNYWVRGSCLYGIMPANGLVYAPPHSCACFMLAKLNGLNALASNSSHRRLEQSITENRLQQGPAFGKMNPETAPNSQNDWPTFRGDATRSGRTRIPVSTDLEKQWQTTLKGKISQPVIAGDKVFVTSVNTHMLHALNVNTGRPVWRFSAGGRIDSPPTIDNGRVIFGSADGYVYCLQETDGSLVWRFRAAPVDRRLMANQQLESVWPVHGSVLVKNDVVYCVAGRSRFLDGGLRFIRLNATTGELLSETVLNEKSVLTDEPLQADLTWPNMPTALPDILSADENHIYMRAQPFDYQGQPIETFTPERYNVQTGERAHLFCPTGFLDDTWWHRTYQLYGQSYISAASGWYLATYHAPAGRLLVMDDKNVYGFGRKPYRFTGTPIVYHLFATEKEPNIINPDPDKPARTRGQRVYGLVHETKPEYHWSQDISIYARAMVLANKTLFMAGPPSVVDELDAYEHMVQKDVQANLAKQIDAFQGKFGAKLMAVSTDNGQVITELELNSPPIFDGMAAAKDKLFISTINGQILCYGN